MSFCVYAYLDVEITTVLLQVCWRYVETTDFVLLRELHLLRLRSSASSTFVCVCLRELHLFGNQTGST